MVKTEIFHEKQLIQFAVNREKGHILRRQISIAAAKKKKKHEDILVRCLNYLF